MTESLESAPVAGVEYNISLPAAAVLPPPFDSESEEALALRYGRRARKTEDLVYEFTRDKGLLHQYYRIYEEQFRAIYKAKNFHVVESDYDRVGQIMVVRQGNFCIGGARICVSVPRQPMLLPLEIDGFRLKTHFPQLEKEMHYGQLSRFVVLPEFRRANISRNMFDHLYRKVVAMNLDMVFAAAPIANARTYKQNCTAMGLKDVKIHMDLNLPEYPTYEEVKHYLVSGVIDKSLVRKTQLETDYVLNSI